MARIIGAVAASHTPTIGFARLSPKVDFGAPDGPADLVFLIAAPDSGGAEHMKLLSSLARALVRKEFVESLRSAGTAGELVDLLPDQPLFVETIAQALLHSSRV